MKEASAQPIGVFDSGIGGLTVAHTIKEVLPKESLVYFGDTAHLPYGDKSEAAVQAYSVKIADILLQKGCKVIVIACNSASSAAYDLLKEYTGRRAKVINVIDPMVSLVKERFNKTKIGLIGTKRTVNSDVYGRKINQLKQDIELKSLATPLLVPMIEEGFFNNKISSEIINKYLSDDDLNGIEALILGCTHYPLIKKQIKEFYSQPVEILDSSLVTAHYLKQYLENEALLNNSGQVKDQFLVSDFTRSFEASAKLFFKDEVHLESYPLWD
ncbi:glutamate racemase [Fulvivirga sp. RKSG066]|uniref:glutamate racemase n=1 Tax=Fulvivirga aurantia TaxID=2529383 RepID=UPI0012BCC690|nr:glutamate racemase [Fulvivirga aurantia]MTI21575.1 glutamate racemase [Fulvivirga aurantia]